MALCEEKVNTYFMEKISKHGPHNRRKVHINLKKEKFLV
jgi:hypothetical protein